MSGKGFTITKSLTYTFGMTLAVPCASLFMMYALDHFGRKKTAVTTFICAGIMAIAFANAASDFQLLIAGFVMIFFYQVAGNSIQIFASEVFPTNARASGFGMASGVGRLMTAWIVPAILLIQNNYGLTAGIRIDRHRAVHRGLFGNADGPGIQTARARRSRRADRLIRIRQNCGARFGAMPGRASALLSDNVTATP